MLTSEYRWSGSYEDEEKARNVMGLSARAKCLVLLELTECLGDKPEVVATKLASDWSPGTVKRYVAVARKLNSQPTLLQSIVQLEYELGRESFLDGITALRNLTGLNVEESDAVFLATWLQIFILKHPVYCLSMFEVIFLSWSAGQHHWDGATVRLQEVWKHRAFEALQRQL